MSKLYPVLIPKALGWLLMAGITPYSRTVVAQMWPMFVISDFVPKSGLPPSKRDLLVLDQQDVLVGSRHGLLVVTHHDKLLMARNRRKCENLWQRHTKNSLSLLMC